MPLKLRPTEIPVLLRLTFLIFINRTLSSSVVLSLPTEFLVRTRLPYARPTSLTTWPCQTPRSFITTINVRLSTPRNSLTKNPATPTVLFLKTPPFGRKLTLRT